MEAYLYEAVRTPGGIGKNTGNFEQVSPVELTTTL